MRTLCIRTAAALSLFAIVGACAKKQDETPPPNVAPGPNTPPGYPGYQAPPAQTQGTYGQPAPYPQAPAQTAPMQTAAPAGQMAVPGPVAFQCQSDVQCGTHHCNTQYGKCAFPCQSAADCLSPNSCMMGLCVPPMPQAPSH